MWIGACISSIGTWMQVMAQGMLILNLSNNSAFLLGLDAFLGGIPIFLFFAVVTGFLGAVTDFPRDAIAVLAAAGILNFVWARYCIYRATKAIGMNLVAPLQQLNLVVTLVLAVFVLAEKLDTLRWLGIALVVLGPAITTMRERKKPPAAGASAAAALKPDIGNTHAFELAVEKRADGKIVFQIWNIFAAAKPGRRPVIQDTDAQ